MKIKVQDRITGEEIRYQRRKLGWSQDILAWESGVCKTQIGRLERGECTGKNSTLERLEDAMNIPRNTLSRAKRRIELDENIDRSVGDMKLDILHRGMSERNVKILLAVTKAVADTLEELEKDQYIWAGPGDEK